MTATHTIPVTKRMAERDGTRLRVCLLGCSLETANRGVSALAYSLIRIFKTVAPNSEITLLMGAKRGGERAIKMDGGDTLVRVVNFRLSPWAPIQQHLLFIFALAMIYRLCPLGRVRRRMVRRNTWLESLQRSSFVGEIFGGDSFGDIYGLFRLLLESLPALTVLLLRRKIALLPQTYGPYRHPIARWIARIIISRAHIIMARDRQSLEIADRFRYIRRNRTNDNKVIFCPDVAFVLGRRDSSASELARRIKSVGDSSLIGLNISGLLYRGGYTQRNMFALRMNYREFVSTLVAAILSGTSAQLLLIPHVYGEHNSVNNDLTACEEVYSLFRGLSEDRMSIIDSPYGPEQLKAAIGVCDFFVGSRMHSCIASLSQGVPTVGIAYSRKFLGVFESAGFRDMVVDARRVTAQEAVARVLSVYRGGCKAFIPARASSEIAQRVMQTFREAIFAPMGVGHSEG